MATSSSRRDFLGASAGLAIAARASAASLAATFMGSPAFAADDDEFVPRSGQYGKDVIWIPTPDSLVTRMLQLAQLRESDSLVDLGSGDGKIVIAAARDFGARARGIEYNEKMVEFARRSAEKEGVSERASFEQGDIFESDFSSANVVTMYLMPNLNLRLRHTLLAMKPGTRVVSHEFRMGDWDITMPTLHWNSTVFQ